MTKVSFYKKSKADYDALGVGYEIGAIYFVESGNYGQIYLNGKCYGEATLAGATVKDITLVTEGENSGSLGVVMTSGAISYIPLPEGHVYSGENGIIVSDDDVISADVDYISDNVKLGSNLTVTNATGTLKVGDKVSADTSLKALLKKMLQEVKQPGTPTAPKLTITLTNSGAKEVGTKVTPAYTTTFNAGSYTYGPATGVSVTEYSVSNGTVTKNTATGSFDEITVEDDTNYKITASASYSDGVVANDNTGTKSNPEVKISAGTTASVTSAAITGFRSWFVGTSTQELGEANYTSDFVRSLTNKNSAPNTNEFTIKIVAGTRRVFVALPAGWKLSYCKDSSALNSDIAPVFKTYSVEVEGANKYAAASYTLFAYEPSIELIAATYSVKLEKSLEG